MPKTYGLYFIKFSNVIVIKVISKNSAKVTYVTDRVSICLTHNASNIAKLSIDTFFIVQRMFHFPYFDMYKAKKTLVTE